ncbi:MAG: LssY C-terminal domain-containing protein, partial [Brachybacterium sp.]
MTPARSAQLIPLDRPVPTESPDYDHARGHAPSGRRVELYSLLDNLFIAAGVVVSIWLALLYLVEGFSLTPVRLLYLLGFWVLLTYITLPRLHQLMTWIYLPDYFFGRTRTTEGVLSDPINLAFDGPERDLHVAMRRAGWALAEERTLASAWSMIRSTLLRRSYPAAPVSDLYLMGRRHDFTYQQEVGGTTAKRHHVRFWRMPRDFVLPGGYRADWLAAGTYDRAVGFSFFTLQITHRIDENIDVERDYV